ncbi:MAG: inorganic diphosphatase [Bdellovibrionales bacterium]|nr:inorganic diphosphatase [Bdellovibrionales bacterium]
MHPWHNVEAGDQPPDLVNALIEIPKGSKAKFELDKKSGLIRMDRVLYSAVHYPANYGFIPQTYCDDHDPLDILVISQEKAVPLCIMRARPVGLIKMLDQGEADDKIIAIHTDDPEFSEVNRFDELPIHRIREIQQFFREYKTLENKSVKVEDILPKEEALEVIKKALKDYQKAKNDGLTFEPR